MSASCRVLITMAHQVVLLYDSDTSEFVEVGSDDNACHSGTGSNSLSWTSGAIDVGSSISTTYCQCDEDTLAMYHTWAHFLSLIQFAHVVRVSWSSIDIWTWRL